MHDRNYSRALSVITLEQYSFVSHKPNTRVKRKIPQDTNHYSCFFVNLDVSCAVAKDCQVSAPTATYQPISSSLPQAPSLPPRPPHSYFSTIAPSTGQRQTCFAWNKNPAPEYSHQNCEYEHVCYFCFCDPTVANKNHKAMFCPNWKPRSPQRDNPRLR